MESRGLKGVEHTLARRVECTGIGLHTGEPVTLALRPAAAGTGILFERSDLEPRVRFPARADWVVDTRLATTLGNGDARVATIEHLLSALSGMGIDNCTVEVAGPELPIMDGSAAAFVYLIRQAGLRPLRRVRRRIVLRKPLEVRDGDRFVRVVPSRSFRVSLGIDFAHPSIGRQSLELPRVSPRVYAREIAPARTFGFLEDLQALQAAGLARGGSLANAIVLDAERVRNPGGLRSPDEFARHKVLDLMGDLALLGLPLQGHVKAMRSGHALHQALVAELRANPDCWTVEVPRAEKTRPPAIESSRLPALRYG